MLSEWRDEAHTIAALIHDDGRVEIVEPGSANWEEVVAMPPSPYTPPDPAIALQRARESASLPRAEFLLACVSAGLLTPQDAMLAAKGEMPAAYAGVIEEWPEPQQFEAGLRWAALTVVDRVHPLILAVADAMSISDAQLDALFGIEPQDGME